MRHERHMRFLLFCLRFFVVLNILLFFYLLYHPKLWPNYRIVNATLILGYVWFNFFRLFYVVFFMKQDYAPLPEETGYSVVIPFYNEDAALFKETILSVINQKDGYRKELILVDDGSIKDACWKVIEEVKSNHPDFDINAIRLDENKGKRNAHDIAFRQAKYEYIVVMDSDTVIDKDSIHNLLVPFSDKAVGAVTGNIKIRNEYENLLTRVQAGIYWVGLNINRKSQNFTGSVNCCSGCFSAYRKESVLKVIDDYSSQRLYGKECHAGEDRYLTNLLLENKMKIVFVENAFCHTEAPKTLSKYLRQQLRWKRSFYRESLYTLTYSWDVSKLIFFETLFGFLLSNIFNLSVRLVAILFLIFNPMFFFIYLVPAWFLYFACTNAMLFFEEPIKALGYLPFFMMYSLLLYPLNIYAIFNIIPGKWGTR